MLQNGQTEPNRRFGLPEGVRGYVERRSLFVAKRLKNIEKSNEMRFFNEIKTFFQS